MAAWCCKHATTTIPIIPNVTIIINVHQAWQAIIFTVIICVTPGDLGVNLTLQHLGV